MPDSTPLLTIPEAKILAALFMLAVILFFIFAPSDK